MRATTKSNLLTTSEYRARDALPVVRCPKRDEPMQLDELEDVYLLFLRSPHT